MSYFILYDSSRCLTTETMQYQRRTHQIIRFSNDRLMILILTPFKISIGNEISVNTRVKKKTHQIIIYKPIIIIAFFPPIIIFLERKKKKPLQHTKRNGQRVNGLNYYCGVWNRRLTWVHCHSRYNFIKVK